MSDAETLFLGQHLDSQVDSQVDSQALAAALGGEHGDGLPHDDDGKTPSDLPPAEPGVDGQPHADDGKPSGLPPADDGQPHGDDGTPTPGLPPADDGQPHGDDGKALDLPPADGQPDGDDTNKKPRKRTLGDMTPNSKAAEIERRRQQARENSRRWHEKWHSKGVPKNPQGEEAVEDKGHDETAEKDDDDDEKMENVGDEEGMDDAAGGFVPDPTLLKQAVAGDLRKTRMMYLNQWIDWKIKDGENTLSRKELMEVANKAWLRSDLRAQCQAGRKSKVY